MAIGVGERSDHDATTGEQLGASDQDIAETLQKCLSERLVAVNDPEKENRLDFVQRALCASLLARGAGGLFPPPRLHRCGGNWFKIFRLFDDDDRGAYAASLMTPSTPSPR